MPDPSGDNLIQHLNIVVMAANVALPGGGEPPDRPFIYDPSSPGPPESWGPGRTSRTPGAPVPEGGSGFPPNKNGASGGFYHSITFVANDQIKEEGDTFTFTGDEFTIRGNLPPGFTQQSANLASEGASASAEPDTYDITISGGVIHYTGAAPTSVTPAGSATIDRDLPPDTDVVPENFIVDYEENIFVVVPDPDAVEGHCYSGRIRVQVSAPGNPFGWDGTVGNFQTNTGQGDCLESPPESALDLTQDDLRAKATAFYNTHIGAGNWTGTVVQDDISAEGDACTEVSTCPGFVAPGSAGNGVGTMLP